ncbi:HutD/Ves family protein [Dyella japonica]|uniref:Histidine utilization protein HutD n=1 Tax=Dyella japonica A8 TaxID=1217721 RepID=A0A075JUS0_9GAMM|nr:HutD family protein [Dyella japonica]AIF45866.1 histidine utilization protein HutD [Dyella japonica A8]
MNRLFHIIRSTDVQPQPWKNGMGVTREVARFPTDAGSDDFLWRISVAEVNSAAPFSTFPGIDRQIVLLDGDGFTMTLDGNQQHALTTPLEPFAFSGEAAVDVAMAGGATRDFNLMVRRSYGTGAVRVCRERGSHEPDPRCVLVYVARGSVTTIDGPLQAGDAWLPDRSPFELAEDTVVLMALVQPG